VSLLKACCRRHVNLACITCCNFSTWYILQNIHLSNFINWTSTPLVANLRLTPCGAGTQCHWYSKPLQDLRFIVWGLILMLSSFAWSNIKYSWLYPSPSFLRTTPADNSFTTQVKEDPCPRKRNVIAMTIKRGCQGPRDPRGSKKLVKCHKNLLTKDTSAHRAWFEKATKQLTVYKKHQDPMTLGPKWSAIQKQQLITILNLPANQRLTIHVSITCM
jgi:hypothetical protein